MDESRGKSDRSIYLHIYPLTALYGMVLMGCLGVCVDKVLKAKDIHQ